ncbi:hypothetical protein [Cellulomonas sp. URHD0024]|uniref:hypothetical protein n=1 Tax=Cellulomonas sp. URHD0024 TaxID=1302620 RepID=UPI0004042B89|nr:hypothetical protein [Cellulomonas sp. URHD0024]
MSARSALRGVARRALTLPGVRRAAKAVARRSPSAKTFGVRVLGLSAGQPKRRRTGKVRIDIRSGHMMLPGQGSRWPITVVVAVGCTAGDTERLAAAVERAQLTSGRFRPLFVVDSGELAPFRSRNYAVEVVMPRGTYARVNAQDSYGEYLYERVSQIVSTYGARSVVPVVPSAIEDMSGDVLRLVGTLDL